MIKVEIYGKEYEVVLDHIHEFSFDCQNCAFHDGLGCPLNDYDEPLCLDYDHGLDTAYFVPLKK